MRLVDSHCHLQADRFATDAVAVAAAARAAGVERMLVPGWNLRSSRDALALADRIDGLDVAVGIHPHDASSADEPSWREIERLASSPGVAAIGETGLDYDRVFSPIDAQLVNLRRHLALARDLGVPVVLHCRSAAGRHDAQDALLRELDAAALGRRRAAGRDHPFLLRAARLRARGDRARVCRLVQRPGIPARRGAERRGRGARAGRTGCWSRRTRRISRRPAPRGAATSRSGCAVTAAWLAERRGVDPGRLGDDLVRSYDAAAAVTSPGAREVAPNDACSEPSRRPMRSGRPPERQRAARQAMWTRSRERADVSARAGITVSEVPSDAGQEVAVAQHRQDRGPRPAGDFALTSRRPLTRLLALS